MILRIIMLLHTRKKTELKKFQCAIYVYQCIRNFWNHLKNVVIVVSISIFSVNPDWIFVEKYFDIWSSVFYPLWSSVTVFYTRIKFEKKCNCCLPQKLKSTFFEKISSGGSPKRGAEWRNKKFNSSISSRKKTDFRKS